MAKQSKVSEKLINASIASMAILFIILWLMPQPPSMSQIKFMPLWIHITCEMFSIMVAMFVFGVTWNSYKVERDSNLIILACGLLSVGLIDFLHLLSFTGMPDFITPSGPEKTINFWLVARLIAAITLLTVAVNPWQPFQKKSSPYIFIGISLSVTFLTAWLGIYHQDLWPRTFVEGSGLTAFKIGSEYIISGLLSIAAFLFYKSTRQEKMPRYDIYSLFGASCVTILSELSFVNFHSFTDIFQLLGHLYKISAYLLIYRVVFISSVRAPFESLEAFKEKLLVSESMLQSVIDNVPVRVFWKDRELRFLGANKLFLKDVGLSHINEIVGKKSEDLFTEYNELYSQDDYTVIRTGNSKLNYEVPFKKVNGESGWLQTSKVPLKDTDTCVIGILVTFTDITERKKAEQTIEFQANYDALTQLPNRRYFNIRLEHEVKSAVLNGKKFALALLDIDNFKEVNDTLGHSAGDELLKQVAQRLINSVRDIDTVSRLGGDEFTIIISNLKDNNTAEVVAQKLLKALSEPFKLEENKIFLTVSIGLTIYPDDTNLSEDMLKNSDQAMYQAKLQGRNRHSYFTSDMQVAAQNRLQLTNELRVAIEEKQFSLVYQPIVELSTGFIHKAEALIRWQHPKRGAISPIEFIPIAEITGLIVEIGDWVFYEACNQVKCWRNILAHNFQISINKSPVQFTHKRQGFKEWFDFLRELDLPGESIVIEITEGLVLNADASIKNLLMKYSEANIGISLDDFGTGYSSLTYLKKYDIDYIKIDRSFISNISSGSEDLTLCETMIEMAHKLGIKVIAEGIETEEQLELLISAGCDYGQGYWFSKPLAPKEFENYFMKRNKNFIDSTH
ncbi:bifunctional diguanylate cyclase/phosphodiesterase [Methylotenera versatilis]|uniref:Diguanylate cyclase/phosphodiesterase with PAS/PAC sensor(S) n=1 Tax=Methylotenera versatilis (strain 301) TaxID=666681 RepID=D7DKL5_METV0|nr:EAL domain-containing protein [Methylotenera versatilis]ADI30461.1 diguanylate cyclase/phosphodiesterase with PAS/PAC sensor(s) [Methylotenera versatilis 301]